MKKLFVTLCLVLALTVSAATLALNGAGVASAAVENAFFVYTEYENVDDTYSTSIYFSVPQSFCVRYGIATVRLDATLPSLLAYEMFARPYGEELSSVVSFPNGQASCDDPERGVSWVCQRSMEDGEYAIQAVMTFDNVQIFLDYLSRARVFGTRSMYRTDGYQEGGSRFDASNIFRSDSAFYRISGVKLVEPMADVIQGWKAGYASASDGAFGTFWHGRALADGSRMEGFCSVLGEQSDAVFTALTADTVFGYQFVSPDFNGANGEYVRTAGLRAGMWMYDAEGNGLSSPVVAKMLLRSPRLWLWYVVGTLIIVAIGVIVFFVLRHNDRVRKAYQARTQQPYTAPFTSPVQPFEDYDAGASVSEKTPFGDEYENKDE